MAYKKRSLQDLRAVIENAGTPNWTGNAGLETMMLNLVDLLLSRGILAVNSVDQLAALGGDETTVVAVRGKGLYKFNPNSSGTLPDSTIVSSKGAWELFGRTPGAPYRLALGDNASTSFTVRHNLDSAFPSVTVFAMTTPNAFPYTIATDYTATITDANTITITQTGGAPWAGNSHTVVVKP